MSEAMLAPQLTAVPAAAAAGAPIARAPSTGSEDGAGLFGGFLATAMAGGSRLDRNSSADDGSSRTLLSAVSAAPLLPETSDEEPIADPGGADASDRAGAGAAAVSAPVTQAAATEPAPGSGERAAAATSAADGSATTAQGSTPGAPQTLPDALAAIGTATATDPVLIDAATDATVAAAGASATATRAANTAIAIDLVAFGPGSAGAAGEAEGTVAPASAVALAAPTDSGREDALAALAQRAATDPAGAATDTGKVGTAAAPSTDSGSDTSAAAHSAAGATQSTASRQATGDRADMAFRMLLETTAFEVTTDTTPADDFRALAPQPPRQTPPATRADLAADLLDRVRNEQAASQHAGEGATDDPAVTIARSTATRDTAGTALAAALLAGDVDARKPAIKAAAGGHAQGAAATAASSDGDTTASTQPADAGKAPTPPPAPAGGIAAAASSFAARIKAAAAERGDTVTTATMAPSANGAGAGGTAAPTAGTASASLAQSFAATLGAGVGGQAGGSAGVSTAMAQIAAEISRRAAAGATRFQIRLDPAELGRIDVRLSLDDKGAARAVLSVERKDTFDLITRDHRALERTLREAGYEVRDGSVQVSLKQNEGNGSGNANSGGNNAFERFAQQQGQQGQGQRGSARAFPEQAAELAPDADTLSRTPTFLTRPTASGRVDIRI